MFFAAGLLSFVTSGPARAAGDFDVFALRSPGLHINSGSCRYIAVTARTNASSSIEEVDAEVDLWLGGANVGSVSLSSGADVRHLSGRYFFCPGLEEPGAYRLGPSQVSYYDYDYNSGDFVDDSRGTMVAKQATRASWSVVRQGKVRTFSLRAQYFDASWEDSWQPFPKGTKVRLDRRRADGTGAWTKVAVTRIGKQGRSTISVRANKVFQYRLANPGTARSWRLVSSTLRK